MITVDWSAIYTGFWIGVVASTLFFAGLAVSVRWVLRTGRPDLILLPSSAVRIALLLGVGWWVTGAGDDGWAFVGYVGAFFLVRLIATLVARRPRAGEHRCN